MRTHGVELHDGEWLTEPKKSGTVVLKGGIELLAASMTSSAKAKEREELWPRVLCETKNCGVIDRCSRMQEEGYGRERTYRCHECVAEEMQISTPMAKQHIAEGRKIVVARKKRTEDFKEAKRNVAEEHPTIKSTGAIHKLTLGLLTGAWANLAS